MGRALVEGCNCAATMDDIGTKIESSDMIPVCSNSTIVFDGSAIDVSNKEFRLFSADCDGNEDKLSEPAVLEGNEHFLTTTGSAHNITLSRVKFVRKGSSESNCIHTKGTGGILDVLDCAFEGSSANYGRAILNEQGTVNVRDCSF
eukprot:CAMPEP_0194032230 /NCGR_PEP_ID=MMETSP0009_2-20130614/5212_1 /TAXON_ID=210454 /ORGANISM="Grammatophora oceanica, Strain CCMP 410" /LENGTH=145 /DNA_ID=CAMNT_0038672601 /DNA_START=928 /DNA_END=1362 /DNA_ORIENTATION=+